MEFLLHNPGLSVMVCGFEDCQIYRFSLHHNPILIPVSVYLFLDFHVISPVWKKRAILLSPPPPPPLRNWRAYIILWPLSVPGVYAPEFVMRL